MDPFEGERTPQRRAGDPPAAPRCAGAPGRAPLPRRPAATVLGLLVLAGCATTGSLREQRGEGLTRFYEAPFEEVWRAAVHAIEANGLRLDLTDRSERFIAASHIPSGRAPGEPEESVAVSADQGERIGIFVDSVAPGTWGVEVVTRRRFALDPSARDWERDVFLALERELGGDARVPRSGGPPDGSPEASPEAGPGG